MKKLILGAGISALAVLPMTAMAYQAGDMVLRVGAATVDPDTDSDAVVIPALGVNLNDGVDVDDNTQLGITFAYFFKDQWAVQVLADQGWDWMTLASGMIPGSMGEVSALAIAFGAFFLILTGVASWRIMAGCVVGLAGTALLFNAFAGADSIPLMNLPWYYHLVMGGFAFGAAFMATDPVSAAHTERGRWLYGIGIGILCVIIRVANPAYPEGMMLAILFMNVFAPLIDYYVVQATTKRRKARMATA